MASSKIYVHDCSSVPPVALVLFGGDLELNRGRDRVLIGGGQQMKMNEVHAVLMKQIQLEIEAILTVMTEAVPADTRKRQSALITTLQALLSQKLD